ncbi:uncharacterized protein LOC124289725 [Haliotis rubra]|uniref:uncharacterized protein LOC124289725 n=1 Tax=Haliotis rubra TaxID=36100 RepID=UPI001EE51F5C|nr:uncharacterized protein LOC124289725 [Haliotis rubra]
MKDDRMRTTMLNKRNCFILCILVTIIIGYMWFYPSCHGLKTATSITADEVYSVWPQFTADTVFTEKYFDERCFRMTDMSIGKLDFFVKEWGMSSKTECRDLYQRFTAMFSVSKRPAPVILPKPFQAKVKNWLGDSEELFQQVYKQEVTHVFNRITREYTIFNPLRDKRPMKTPAEPERQYVERLVVNSRESCDFCNYKNFTAEHETHRLESSMSYTASNTFKMEKWHALFMFKKHHPLNWNRAEFMDLMKLSQEWFKVALKRDPVAQYPQMVWDMFPHAGASQIHPHVHGFLTPHMYHGVVEAAEPDSSDVPSFTAEHETHRLESSMSYTASNTFKMEKWHALFMFKKHHPLNWNRAEFMDLMKLSQEWFKVAHKRDPVAQYPQMVWDMFPHAGASQIHPHVHGFLTPHMYHGVVEAWREGAEEYYRRFNHNYFTDLVSVYSAMGLSVRHGEAVAVASIAPKKDHEVIIFSPTSGESFFQLIYYTLRAFIDDIDKLCFSMGIGLPPLGSDAGAIPAYARVVTRGAVADVRTDMSSLELFAGTNVNIDPYKVIKLVRSSIKHRHSG